jgi:hypothetical protein
VIVIIEEMHATETVAGMVDALRRLSPRLVLVDMAGPQAAYALELSAAGFQVQPLTKPIKARLE